MALTDEGRALRARTEAEAAERKAATWEGRRPLMDPAHGARTIGDLALIEPGCAVWSCQRVDANEEALGGIVLEITSTGGRVTDDGEIIPHHRAFRVVNPYISPPSAGIRLITEAEVLIDGGCELPESSRLVRVIRRMAREIDTRNATMLLPSEGALIHWMVVLAGVVLDGAA